MLTNILKQKSEQKKGSKIKSSKVFVNVGGIKKQKTKKGFKDQQEQ